MAKDTKGSQRGFCTCVRSKSWAREWVRPLLSGKEKLSEDGSEKAEVPRELFLLSALLRTSCGARALAAGPRRTAWSACAGTAARNSAPVLRKPAEAISVSLVIIFENLQRTNEA